LKVIPVIDILNGVTVHAIQGKRNAYQPLQSILTRSADPLETANTFKTLGFSELYIADLDAILSGTSAFELPQSLCVPTGLSLMVDAGVSSIEQAERLLKSGVSKLIIGTETLLTMAFIAEAVEHFGSEHVVVSLDLKDRRVITKTGVDASLDPLHLLCEFEKMGVLEVVVLDLVRVGSGEGVETSFLKRAINETNLSVYTGGGVRNIADLIELKVLGVTGVLVATALHRGKLSVEDLKRYGFL
jgi:phosphoribosylformimino-5-aminoimidazole carboxamide ribotide isomerase